MGIHRTVPEADAEGEDIGAEAGEGEQQVQSSSLAVDRDAEAKREFRAALSVAEREVDLVEPTPDDIRNGWDAESLTAYVQEQRAAQSIRFDPMSLHRRMARRPREQNHRYNVHRCWR